MTGSGGKALRRPDTVILAHGGGGRASAELVEKAFLPSLGNKFLAPLSDGAILPPLEGRLAFSTDSYVIDPIFFPGGDIGSLAIHGTVNDLSMCGATPVYLSAGFILEEGFPMADLKRIADSMGEAARESGVTVVTGDTKVVARGGADKIFINTAGIGVLPEGVNIAATRVREGDRIILSGTLGDHGTSVLIKRKGLKFDSPVESDSRPLNGLVREMLDAEPDIHMMRDPTRGGLAAVLNEVARAAGVGMVIEETAIPVNGNVAAVCELLGIDVLHVANEGKMVAFVPEASAERVLSVMKTHTFGRDAAIIGMVGGTSAGRVEMKTSFIGNRIIEPLAGEQLPRIC
ncbi:MAG: hydrogenase expression/formation protein HypE [Nitrospinae bacterium]|nr:hydrogenase expression/formation protein HypE [Nitrospinota bacterium]